MKLSTLTALATLLGTMALPMVGLAQERGRGGSQPNHGKGHPDNGNDKNRGRGNASSVSKNRDQDRNRNETRRNDDRQNDARRNEDRRNAPRSNGGGLQSQSNRRQQTKNEWRNIGLASGGVAVLGLLKKDNTLTFAGAAGALYSLNRYEQDRKSQSSLDRTRANVFSKSYFVRDGVRYNRREMVKNGQRHYQFVRAR